MIDINESHTELGWFTTYGPQVPWLFYFDPSGRMRPSGILKPWSSMGSIHELYHSYFSARLNYHKK